MQIKIDLGKTGAASGLLAARGARNYTKPTSILIDEFCTLPALHTSRKPVPPEVQLSHLQRSLDSPNTGSWWLVIGSLYDEDLANSVALGIMLRAMVKSIGSHGSIAQPFLHALYGGNYDRLRDKEEYRQGIGNIGMLILTNLATNSTREKLEKARDLLHMYNNIPRVLVISGGDPLAFALDQLHASPSRVLNLGKHAKAKTRQV